MKIGFPNLTIQTSKTEEDAWDMYVFGNPKCATIYDREQMFFDLEDAIHAAILYEYGIQVDA